MRRRRARSSPGSAIFIALVAGLVGFLLRGLFSESAPEPEAPVVTLLACPQPDGQPASPKASARRQVTPAGRPSTPLPKLGEVDDAREALLEFVRSRSKELASCAGERRERLRLTVQLDVAESGAVEAVSVLEDEAALASVHACVERGMRAWTLPSEWLSGQRTLLVSVVL